MQTIQLDISQKTEIQVIEAKQDDVGRKFQAVILDSGEPFLIPLDAVISLWYSGASGEGNYTEIEGRVAFSVYENKITVELISQMLRLPGSGQMCLVILDRSGRQIGLWNIPYHVEKIPGMGSEGAKDYFSAMTKLLRDMETDKSLTVADKPADAKAVGDALRRAGLEDGLMTDGGAAGNLEELSQIVYSVLNNMATPACEEVSVICDFDNFAGVGRLTIHKAFGTDSAHEASVMLVTSNGDILFGASYDDSLEGQWLPIEWAWSNPPMEIGVEYKTMERHMNCAVYTKLVFFGPLTNGTAKFRAHGITMTQMLRCSGYITEGNTLPASGSSGATVYCGQESIVIEAEGDLSDRTAYVQLWYTKD